MKQLNHYVFGDGDGNAPVLETRTIPYTFSASDLDDLNWPSSDILVSYKAETQQVIFSAVSTGEILKVHNIKESE